MMKKGFTLLELVVVIIILGVLATLGFTQYGAMVEKARGAEARQIFGDMRNLAIAYRLANGSITGFVNANANIGTAADQIPSACRSSHYFYYNIGAATVDPIVELVAYRCTTGGKTPQTSGNCCVDLQTNLVTGSDTWFGAACDHEGCPTY